MKRGATVSENRQDRLETSAQHANKPDHTTQDRTTIGKKPFPTHPVTILQKGILIHSMLLLYISILKSMPSCFSIETASFQLCVLSKATAHQKPKDCAIGGTLYPPFMNSVQRPASYPDRRCSCLPPMLQNPGWQGKQSHIR
jgi:hypothetical protein